MGAGDYVTAPKQPLNVTKLDAKSFVQLTVWILVVLTAWAIASFAFKFGKTKVSQLAGKTTDTGSTNPFFG